MNRSLPTNILVVEDDEDFCDNLKDILQDEKYFVKTAGNYQAALDEIYQNHFPVVLLDLKLPGCSGISILKEIKRIHPDTLIIIMTAFASVETAINALKEDAYSYLTKPINMDELLILLKRAFEDADAKQEKENLFRELAEANIKMKQQNEEIIKKNRELELKNDELAAFFYTLSHDLKSSVVTFHGYLDFLKDMDLNPEVRQFVTRLQAASVKMSDHIKGLLKVSRIGNIKEDKELLNPGNISRDIVNEIPPNMKPPNLKIKIADDFPEIHYNKKEMEQILENLINNAMKFTVNSKKPMVEIGWLQSDNPKKYIIFVKDNGIGIASQNHEKIFEIFHQINEIPNPDGTGVGLSIVKRIINNNQGEISVESEKGKGSTFRFSVTKPNKAGNWDEQ